MGPLGRIFLLGPPIKGPLGPPSIDMVGDESSPGTRPGPDTGFPSGPSMGAPRGELIIPCSILPMEPRPESGPWPTLLGVEQGVVAWPVSCWDIWAIEEIGSKALVVGRGPGPPGAWLPGVPGLRGMLMSCCWGGRPRLEGDTPPGKRLEGEAGTGKRGSVEGARGACWPVGVPGQSPRYMPGSWEEGVWGAPGYLGGAEGSPSWEPGVWGAGEAREGSGGCGVEG